MVDSPNRDLDAIGLRGGGEIPIQTQPGPLKDELACRSEMPPDLPNTLLDIARFDVGRIQIGFKPTDLSSCRFPQDM